jgi:ribosomal protein S12 methylthiotransferase
MIKQTHGNSPSNRSTKSFFIENLGCAKNQVDAEILGKLLTDEGFRWAETPESADCICINSCGFIKSAKEESIRETLDYRKRYPDKKIILTGCFAQRYAAEADKKLRDIDGIVGNRSPEAAAAAVQRVLSGGRVVEVPPAKLLYPRRERFLSYPGSVYVKISEGCNNGCTYCAIPLIRGPLSSRSPEDITDEIAGYIGAGTAEIVLLAQDLASFGTDGGRGEGLTALLRRIMELPGDFWLRLLYMHPDHVPEDLFACIRDNERVLPYLDIPFQHASKRVLRRMGRSGDGPAYLRLIDRIRNEIPGAVIRSTFLVGFPGEEEEDFTELLKFQREAALDWLGVFTYSREEDTPAYRLQSALGYRLTKMKGAAEKRKSIIQETQQEITTARLREHVGSPQRVLIEEAVAGERLFIGRTYFQAPEVDGLTVVSGENCIPGRFYRCRITSVTAVDLEATLVSDIGP